MTLPLPKATVTVVPSGLGLIQTPPDSVVVFMGPSSKGDALTPRSFTVFPSCIDTFGCGPGPKSAAYVNGKTGASFVFVKLPKTARAASKTAVTKVGTGTSVMTLSGTPKDWYEIKMVTVVGGTIGTSATIKVSINGGETYGANVALAAANTYLIPGTGVTINFGAGTLVADDYITARTDPGSEAVLPVTVTRVDDSTFTATAAGTPEDDYEVELQWLSSGAVGTAGLFYRYSLDGGYTFTTKRALGTDLTITLMDGEEAAGPVITLVTTETVDEGDTIAFNTTGPTYQASDVALAIEALKASANRWSFLVVMGATTAAGAASIGGELTSLDNLGKPTWVALEGRDRGTNETKVDWAARVIADFDSFGDDRVGIGTGRARVTCPVTKRQNRRSNLLPIVARCIAFGPEVDPGRKASRALSSDVLLVDENNVTVEHDARLDDSLHAAGFLTLRTYWDEDGVYVTRGNIKCAEGSDFNRIAFRRVMDIGSIIFRKVMQEQLENGVFANGVGKANPDAIREVDCARIDREILTALEAELNGKVSGIQVLTSRTEPVRLTGKAKAVVKLDPLIYIDEFEGEIGFTSSALATIQNG